MHSILPKALLLGLGIFLATTPLADLQAQQDVLPKGFSSEEQALLPWYNAQRTTSGITTPPGFPVRAMAEWEEIDYLVITWTGYTATLREVVRHAVQETDVLIVCTDSNTVKNNLNGQGIPTTRVHYLQRPFDSVWMRDYGANTVYQNGVDSVLLVEWIYNRPRPDDDVLPEAIATQMALPHNSTTQTPFDLVHTGGNFHTDGMGTAFSSELVLEENAQGNPYGVTVKSETDIDSIMGLYMGIERYIKMPTLPYDGIHHIDMHWRLLDEETLLIGEYPAGIADGPQIEANLQYVLSNHLSVWGTPYRVIRIQMPPDGSGLYPHQGPSWNPGDYRTYTNSVFVNKTLLVPVYEQQYDTMALRILRQALPGYKVIGIDCNTIIQASGALHCITREVGSSDQLRIVHQRLRDTYDDQNPYLVRATISHRTGITNATLYWTTDTLAGYQSVSMNPMSMQDGWNASIPAQPQGTEIFYYISADATNGKAQVRPMPAPQGYWNFKVLGTVSSETPLASHTALSLPFPNPASAITCIPVHNTVPTPASISLWDMTGRKVLDIFQGELPAGESRYFLHADRLAAGAYQVVLETGEGRSTQRLMVR